MAADYSQLELRILAHLSRDRRLIQVLNTGADVFRSIAAEWKMVEPDAVGDDLRQQAKQVSLGDSFMGTSGFITCSQQVSWAVVSLCNINSHLLVSWYLLN